MSVQCSVVLRIFQLFVNIGIDANPASKKCPKNVTQYVSIAMPRSQVGATDLSRRLTFSNGNV